MPVHHSTGIRVDELYSAASDEGRNPGWAMSWSQELLGYVDWVRIEVRGNGCSCKIYVQVIRVYCGLSIMTTDE